MSAKITTAFGDPVPPAPRHSVTVHMPGWDAVQRFGSNPPAFIGGLKHAYPRMKPHQDILDLEKAVLKHLGIDDQRCLLLPSLQTAKECVEYCISPRRDDGTGKKPVAPDQIRIRALEAKDRFYAVFFPSDKWNVAAPFWANPGSEISSRFAEANLREIKRLVEIPELQQNARNASFEGPTHDLLRQRILHFLNRAPRNPGLQPKPAMDDVFFFATGMAAIYKPHTYFLSHYNGSTVLVGMAFLSTPALFDDLAPGWRLFDTSDDSHLDSLETYLRDESKNGRKVQAIWAEFPGTPNLLTPDLSGLRSLADKYDIVLGIDDTIGGFANLDVMEMADLVVTSLTKSFNGYADVIAGSAVLNPQSRKYAELKSLFKQMYVPELYVDDAEAILKNTGDYLSRAAKLNFNGNALVQYLGSCAEDPDSAVCRVHHPSVNPSGKHYRQFMRPATPEFTPGYSYLFSVEFEDLPSTVAFYNNLNVHIGPHQGAPFTLAIAYALFAFNNKLEWAAQYGVKPTQIRISSGLEDTETLLEDFRIAVEAANKARLSQK